MHGRWALIASAVVVFLLVASQLLIPRLGERQVEDRLTAGGGEADVTIGAVPALRLLFSDGERFEVRAHDLALDPNELDQGVFDRLDGFGIVDVAIADSTAGPFDLHSFNLTRDGDEPYRLTAQGTASPTALADYGFERVQLPAEGLLDALLNPFLDQADVPVPVHLDMQVVSDDGRIRVVGGDGKLAGFSMGPLAEFLTSAVVVEL
jgi:hypothetical protein